MEKTIDPLTKIEFVKKRSNQRFACRANQIRYNNLLAQQKRLKKAKVDRPLDKNRNILKQLLGKESEVKKSREWLMALDFDFIHFTHYSKDQEGKLRQHVYEYFVQNLDGQHYKLGVDASY